MEFKFINGMIYNQIKYVIKTYAFMGLNNICRCFFESNARMWECISNIYISRLVDQLLQYSLILKLINFRR